MISHLDSKLGCTFDIRRSRMVLGLFSLIILVSTSMLAASWETKDWTQWSSQDCYHILWASPWTVNGPELSETYLKSPGHYGETTFSLTAQIASSLVVRQALERQAQLDQHYEKLNPQQRSDFDQRAVACINKNYDDRIIVRGVAGPKIPGPFHLLIDGREIPAIPVPPGNAIFPCPGDQVMDIAFQRVVNGKLAIQPGDKKMVVESPKGGPFTFNIQKMIYKGKPDF